MITLTITAEQLENGDFRVNTKLGHSEQPTEHEVALGQFLYKLNEETIAGLVAWEKHRRQK